MDYREAITFISRYFSRGTRVCVFGVFWSVLTRMTANVCTS